MKFKNPFRSRAAPGAHTTWRVNFSQYLEVAGYTQTPKQIHRRVLVWSIIVAILSFAGVLLWAYTKEQTLIGALASGVVWLLLIAPLSYLVCWLFFYVATDFRVARRREAIENSLPDYLQMAASNIRAGMPIDQALWLAIRPRFGILAVEMEMVAKQTMSGERLEVALERFSTKYKSAILQRTMALLIEGLRAGSEIGALLENVSLDIADMYQRRDNMAANVTQYLIFITFAVAVAAPLMFGMSIQLLKILNTVGADLASQTSSSAFSFSGDSVRDSHFFIFCIISLMSTSFFASLIVSNIKHGNGRGVVKMAPVLALVAISLFLAAAWGLGLMFEDLI